MEVLQSNLMIIDNLLLTNILRGAILSLQYRMIYEHTEAQHYDK